MTPAISAVVSVSRASASETNAACRPHEERTEHHPAGEEHDGDPGDPGVGRVSPENPDEPERRSDRHGEAERHDPVGRELAREPADGDRDGHHDEPRSEESSEALGVDRAEDRGRDRDPLHAARRGGAPDTRRRARRRGRAAQVAVLSRSRRRSDRVRRASRACRAAADRGADVAGPRRGRRPGRLRPSPPAARSRRASGTARSTSRRRRRAPPTTTSTAGEAAAAARADDQEQVREVPGDQVDERCRRAPARIHAGPARPPAARTSAAAATPTATPSADASPAVTAATFSPSVPASAAASAGPRPTPDPRETLVRAHPCPPQVDGHVGANAEPMPVDDMGQSRMTSRRPTSPASHARPGGRRSRTRATRWRRTFPARRPSCSSTSVIAAAQSKVAHVVRQRGGDRDAASTVGRRELERSLRPLDREREDVVRARHREAHERGPQQAEHATAVRPREVHRRGRRRPHGISRVESVTVCVESPDRIERRRPCRERALGRDRSRWVTASSWRLPSTSVGAGGEIVGSTLPVTVHAVANAAIAATSIALRIAQSLSHGRGRTAITGRPRTRC